MRVQGQLSRINTYFSPRKFKNNIQRWVISSKHPLLASVSNNPFSFSSLDVTFKQNGGIRCFNKCYDIKCNELFIFVLHSYHKWKKEYPMFATDVSDDWKFLEGERQRGYNSCFPWRRHAIDFLVKISSFIFSNKTIHPLNLGY